MHRPLIVLLSIIVFCLGSTPLYAAEPSYHTVAWGETLGIIARAYGVSTQALASANGIDANGWVYAGTRLKIPVKTSNSVTTITPAGYYVVRAGDTLTSIAARFGLTAKTLAATNNLPADGMVYVGWTLKIPFDVASGRSTQAESAQTYVVQQGEHLLQIAMRYGTTAQAVALANNLPNYWLVYAGLRLIIPNSSGRTTSSVAPAAAVTNYRVANVPLLRQEQTLTCEEASVAMATRGAVSEARLVAAMPRSDNPFVGIRGKTNPTYYGGLSDYGAYAQAIQQGLIVLGVQSQVLYGQPYDEFKRAILMHLSLGHPVVWWHTWHDTYQNPEFTKTLDGQMVKLVPYEHAGVIVAADERGMTYHDPYDATVRFVSWEDHQRVSAYFDNMALVVP